MRALLAWGVLIAVALGLLGCGGTSSSSDTTLDAPEVRSYLKANIGAYLEKEGASKAEVACVKRRIGATTGAELERIGHETKANGGHEVPSLRRFFRGCIE